MMNERFSRIEQMIGAGGLQKLRQSHVVVVGLGAVGSFAVEALARAGVGRLRLVDFDEVRPSNINRQLYALQSTLGQAKVNVARQRVQDINPHCQVEALACFAHLESMDAILEGRPDLLLDAIDSLNPKVELIQAVVQRQIPLVSSMAAALRKDVNAVRVGPLSATRHCPLARLIRKRLRQNRVSTDFPCVYSVEVLDAVTGREITESQPGEEFYERGRPRRKLGSLPTIPGIFGLAAANEAIRILVSGSRR